MKTKYFILAAAAVALAACSSDETVGVNQGEAISFRPVVNGLTRAANGTGLKTEWETGDILYVYADYNSTKYFQDSFTKDGTGFNSSTKYYWPNDVATEPVTFTAFWGAAQKANDPDELAAAYTVEDAVASQQDLLFAKKTVSAKPADGGVELNFRHMLSQIIVNVANDEPNMKVTISGVRVGYVAKTGTFAYSGGVTDTQETGSKNATLIARTDWTPTAATAATQLFEQTVSATLTSTQSATDLTSYSPWILLPQQLTAASEYTEAESGGAVTSATAPKLNGAYLALKMKIESLDNVTDKNVVGTIVAEQWCYWPIATEWKPGYKYTYTINAGSGGYQPTDQNSNKTDLDPVLKGTFIWFTPTCTIDAWVDEAVNVDSPTSL